MANGAKAKIYTPEELEKIRYKLPASWTRAAGLLRHKKKALERHLQEVRREWDRRTRKQKRNKK